MPAYLRSSTISTLTIKHGDSTLSWALLLFYSLVICGCSTLQNGRNWGEDATLTPSKQQFSQAFYSAITHPATWSPLVGATVIAVTDSDEEISEQLSKDTPFFGSNNDANDASDWLRDSLVASVAVSIIAMPSGTNQREHAINKGKGFLTEIAALKTTSWTTSAIKKTTGRERPNKGNDRSFPSGHTSRAFAAAALTSKNLDSLALSEGAKTGLRTGLYSFAAGTAWARVEANVHYPTDVLAGAALGNFLSRFIHDAFLGLEYQNTHIEIEILPSYSYLGLQWKFN